MARRDDLHRVEQAITRLGRIGNGRVAARYRAERAGVQLSRPAIAVLAVLHEGGSLRLSEIARRTALEAPLVSREVRKLVDRGEVVRRADDTDGRAGIVALTSSGASSYRAYRRATDEIVAETFTSWSATELHSLAATLERVAADFARSPSALGT